MPKWVTLLSLGLAVLPGLAVAKPDGGREEVPLALQGIWGQEGRCDIAADRLTITSRTASRGDGPFEPVFYAPDEKAIHWDQEYETENFVAGRSSDVLVDDTEGFGMPDGEVGYARCGPGLARLPWPYHR